MIAENNLESHGSWTAALMKAAPMDTIVPGDNMDWEPMMLDRVNSCYQRDKNHPAILIWSVGNEAFGGKVVFDMSEKFRELDHIVSFIMKESLTTEDMRRQAIWKARCILRLQRLNSSLQNTRKNRLSAVNIPMQWATPAEPCTSIPI